MIDTMQLCASAVLAAATGTAPNDSQSAHVEESVLSGSTYLVVVLVEATVTVVVGSTQSPQPVVAVDVGSTAAQVS